MSAKTGSRTPLGSRPSPTLPVRPATKRAPRAQKPQLHAFHAENKPLPANFLIATPRLEFPVTHTKLSPLTFSNREQIADFRSRIAQQSRRTIPAAPIDNEFGRASRNAGLSTVTSIEPALFNSRERRPVLRHEGSPDRRLCLSLLTHGRAFRTASIPAGAFAGSRLITHLAAVSKTPYSSSPLTSHKSPVARLFREDPPRRTTSHDFLIYGSAIRNPSKP
jgi:hypothetical protein